jgi:hypothetical protein
MDKEKARVLTLDETHLMKARPHKYIKRLGAPGKYQYVYRMDENKTHKMQGATRRGLFGTPISQEDVPVLPMSRQSKKYTSPTKFVIQQPVRSEAWSRAGKLFKLEGGTKHENKIDAAMESLRSKGYEVIGEGGSGFILPISWRVVRPDGSQFYASKLKELQAELDGRVKTVYSMEKVGSMVVGVDEDRIKKLEDMGYKVTRSDKVPDTGKTFKLEGEEPKMKTFGYDRVKLSNNYSMEELVKLGEQVTNNPENRNPAHLEGKSVYIHTPAARKKLENISWAITYKLAEAKKLKTFNMEGEAPRHVILEGGPNRRLKPEEKATKFKAELGSSSPTHLKPEVKKNMNNMIHDILIPGGKNVWFDEIPLQQIFDIMEAHGVVPLQEDNTEWSGMLLGREAQITLPLAPKGTAEESATDMEYTPFKNATLHLSWYTMPSGRYEILSHVS